MQNFEIMLGRSWVRMAINISEDFVQICPIMFRETKTLNSKISGLVSIMGAE